MKGIILNKQESEAKEQERKHEIERSERDHQHALITKRLEFNTQKLERKEAEANARSKHDFDVAKNVTCITI